MVGILARAARRDQLEHLAVLVLGPRVGPVDLVGLAFGVVGELDVDAPVHRVRLDVLGPVHRRRADQIGGEPGRDQHVRLARKAVLRGQRALALDQRQPGELVLVELGDVERAVVEQRAVGSAGARVEGAARNVFVEIVEALVVAAVQHQPAVLVDQAGRTLMLEATERRVLLGHDRRIVGVVLDDPAKAVRLVRLLGEVEALDRPVPGILRLARDPVALVVGRLRRTIGQCAAEILVEVLLRHQHRAPGGLASGAVVEGAQHPGAGRIGIGLEAVVAGRRADDLDLGRERDPARVLAARDHGPGVALFLDLDRRAAVCHQLDLGLLGGLRLAAPAGEHQLRIGVLVVDVQQAVLGAVGAARQREIAKKVVIVAELPRLSVGALGHRVPGGRFVDHRIAPADQHLGGVAGRHLLVLLDHLRE